MHALVAIVLTTAVALLASAANAVTLSVIGISGADPGAMSPGETLTVDVRVVADGDEVFGLGASVYGYDESVVDYVAGSGEAVGSIFHAIVTPIVIGGLENRLASPLVESAIGANASRVWLFTGTSLAPTSAQPLDPGLDGVAGNGDAQFRFTFQATGPGVAQIEIGTGYEGDGVVLANGQLSQATGEIIDVVVGGGAAVPSIPTVVIYTLLPIALIGVGVGALRNRNRVRVGSAG